MNSLLNIFSTSVIIAMVMLTVAPPTAIAEEVPMLESANLKEEAIRTIFPLGELFQPLVADVIEPQFSTGIHRVKSSGQLDKFTAAVVSYGEHFGLVRLQESTVKAWQVSVVGALFAQFNLDASSKDLINADYTIGLSGTHRNGPASYRLRLIHQSSHLGDELLLGESAPDERINLSLEAVDFLASYKWDKYRAYGGVAYLLNIEPGDLEKTGLQLGGEYYGTERRLFNGRWIGGINLTAYEGVDWNINKTVKYGFEYGKAGSGNRRLRVMLEAYNGKSPFGQFYDVNISSYGMSVYLLF